MMFLLDTNVISEALKPKPEDGVERWFAPVVRQHVFVSSISKAEMLFGLAIMPPGKRKLALADVIWKFFSNELKTEVLAFGSRESEIYAEIASHQRAIGRAMNQSDAQIAAIARLRDFAIVTRNVGDFAHCGVEIVNPWETP